eukprot:TRINITY_DN1380_c0_g1_i1.p1 TRINITY_DN1380_c0_g1~~TRINITY_DN1380_c0_g1_i1.p1  ORF type:complete len:4328 (+),score=573.68 TRINITY_DN1380_c0_g1_i1:948-12986(+)
MAGIRGMTTFSGNRVLILSGQEDSVLTAFDEQLAQTEQVTLPVAASALVGDNASAPWLVLQNGTALELSPDLKETRRVPLFIPPVPVVPLRPHYALSLHLHTLSYTLPSALLRNRPGLTVEIWVRFDHSCTARQHLWRLRNSDPPGDIGLAMQENNGNSATLSLIIDGRESTDKLAVPNGSWHHVVVALAENGSVSMWLDGSQKQKTKPGTVASVSLVADSLVLGPCSAGVCEFRAWGEVRNAFDIRNSWNRRISPGHPHQLIYLPLLLTPWGSDAAFALSDFTGNARPQKMAPNVSWCPPPELPWWDSTALATAYKKQGESLAITTLLQSSSRWLKSGDGLALLVASSSEQVVWLHFSLRTGLLLDILPERHLGTSLAVACDIEQVLVVCAGNKLLHGARGGCPQVRFSTSSPPPTASWCATQLLSTMATHAKYHATHQSALATSSFAVTTPVLERPVYLDASPGVLCMLVAETAKLAKLDTPCESIFVGVLTLLICHLELLNAERQVPVVYSFSEVDTSELLFSLQAAFAKHKQSSAALRDVMPDAIATVVKCCLSYESTFSMLCAGLVHIHETGAASDSYVLQACLSSFSNYTSMQEFVRLLLSQSTEKQQEILTQLFALTFANHNELSALGSFVQDLQQVVWALTNTEKPPFEKDVLHKLGMLLADTLIDSAIAFAERRGSSPSAETTVQLFLSNFASLAVQQQSRLVPRLLQLWESLGPPTVVNPVEVDVGERTVLGTLETSHPYTRPGEYALHIFGATALRVEFNRRSLLPDGCGLSLWFPGLPVNQRHTSLSQPLQACSEERSTHSVILQTTGVPAAGASSKWGVACTVRATVPCLVPRFSPDLETRLALLEQLATWAASQIAADHSRSLDLSSRSKLWLSRGSPASGGPSPRLLHERNAADGEPVDMATTRFEMQLLDSILSGSAETAPQPDRARELWAEFFASFCETDSAGSRQVHDEVKSALRGIYAALVRHLGLLKLEDSMRKQVQQAILDEAVGKGWCTLRITLLELQRGLDAEETEVSTAARAELQGIVERARLLVFDINPSALLIGANPPEPLITRRPSAPLSASGQDLCRMDSAMFDSKTAHKIEARFRVVQALARGDAMDMVSLLLQFLLDKGLNAEEFKTGMVARYRTAKARVQGYRLSYNLLKDASTHCSFVFGDARISIRDYLLRRLLCSPPNRHYLDGAEGCGLEMEESLTHQVQTLHTEICGFVHSPLRSSKLLVLKWLQQPWQPADFETLLQPETLSLILSLATPVQTSGEVLSNLFKSGTPDVTVDPDGRSLRWTSQPRELKFVHACQPVAEYLKKDIPAYFEVGVVATGAGATETTTGPAIGLCRARQSRIVLTCPQGENASKLEAALFGPPFSVGDTIGCGVSQQGAQLSVYFTKNGQFLGWAGTISHPDDWCFSVGSAQLGTVVRANFGQEAFQFDPNCGVPIAVIEAEPSKEAVSRAAADTLRLLLVDAALCSKSSEFSDSEPSGELAETLVAPGAFAQRQKRYKRQAWSLVTQSVKNLATLLPSSLTESVMLSALPPATEIFQTLLQICTGSLELRACLRQNFESFIAQLHTALPSFLRIQILDLLVLAATPVEGSDVDPETLDQIAFALMQVAESSIVVSQDYQVGYAALACLRSIIRTTSHSPRIWTMLRSKLEAICSKAAFEELTSNSWTAIPSGWLSAFAASAVIGGLPDTLRCGSEPASNVAARISWGYEERDGTQPMGVRVVEYKAGSHMCQVLTDTGSKIELREALIAPAPEVLPEIDPTTVQTIANLLSFCGEALQRAGTQSSMDLSENAQSFLLAKGLSEIQRFAKGLLRITATRKEITSSEGIETSCQRFFGSSLSRPWFSLPTRPAALEERLVLLRLLEIDGAVLTPAQGVPPEWLSNQTPGQWVAGMRAMIHVDARQMYDRDRISMDVLRNAGQIGDVEEVDGPTATLRLADGHRIEVELRALQSPHEQTEPRCISSQECLFPPTSGLKAAHKFHTGRQAPASISLHGDGTVVMWSAEAAHGTVALNCIAAANEPSTFEVLIERLEHPDARLFVGVLSVAELAKRPAEGEDSPIAALHTRLPQQLGPCFIDSQPPKWRVGDLIGIRLAEGKLYPFINGKASGDAFEPVLEGEFLFVVGLVPNDNKGTGRALSLADEYHTRVRLGPCTNVSRKTVVQFDSSRCHRAIIVHEALFENTVISPTVGPVCVFIKTPETDFEFEFENCGRRAGFNFGIKLNKNFSSDVDIRLIMVKSDARSGKGSYKVLFRDDAYVITRPDGTVEKKKLPSGRQSLRQQLAFVLFSDTKIRITKSQLLSDERKPEEVSEVEISPQEDPKVQEILAIDPTLDPALVKKALDRTNGNLNAAFEMLLTNGDELRQELQNESKVASEVEAKLAEVEAAIAAAALTRSASSVSDGKVEENDATQPVQPTETNDALPQMIGDLPNADAVECDLDAAAPEPSLLQLSRYNFAVAGHATPTWQRRLIQQNLQSSLMATYAQLALLRVLTEQPTVAKSFNIELLSAILVKCLLTHHRETTVCIASILQSCDQGNEELRPVCGGLVQCCSSLLCGQPFGYHLIEMTHDSAEFTEITLPCAAGYKLLVEAEGELNIEALEYPTRGEHEPVLVIRERGTYEITATSLWLRKIQCPISCRVHVRAVREDSVNSDSVRQQLIVAGLRLLRTLLSSTAVQGSGLRERFRAAIVAVHTTMGSHRRVALQLLARLLQENALEPTNRADTELLRLFTSISKQFGPEPTIECGKCHKSLLQTVTVSYDDGHYSCDGCQLARTSPQYGVYHCSACRWDLCPRCAQKVQCMHTTQFAEIFSGIRRLQLLVGHDASFTLPRLLDTARSAPERQQGKTFTFDGSNDDNRTISRTSAHSEVHAQAECMVRLRAPDDVQQRTIFEVVNSGESGVINFASRENEGSPDQDIELFELKETGRHVLCWQRIDEYVPGHGNEEEETEIKLEMAFPDGRVQTERQLALFVLRTFVFRLTRGAVLRIIYESNTGTKKIADPGWEPIVALEDAVDCLQSEAESVVAPHLLEVSLPLNTGEGAAWQGPCLISAIRAGKWYFEFSAAACESADKQSVGWATLERGESGDSLRKWLCSGSGKNCEVPRAEEKSSPASPETEEEVPQEQTEPQLPSPSAVDETVEAPEAPGEATGQRSLPLSEEQLEAVEAILRHIAPEWAGNRSLESVPELIRPILSGSGEPITFDASLAADLACQAGVEHLDSGNIEEAQALLEASVKLNPNLPTAWFQVSVLYALLGDEAGSTAASERANALQIAESASATQPPDSPAESETQPASASVESLPAEAEAEAETRPEPTSPPAPVTIGCAVAIEEGTVSFYSDGVLLYSVTDLQLTDRGVVPYVVFDAGTLAFSECKYTPEGYSALQWVPLPSATQTLYRHIGERAAELPRCSTFHSLAEVVVKTFPLGNSPPKRSRSLACYLELANVVMARNPSAPFDPSSLCLLALDPASFLAPEERLRYTELEGIPESEIPVLLHHLAVLNQLVKCVTPCMTSISGKDHGSLAKAFLALKDMVDTKSLVSRLIADRTVTKGQVTPHVAFNRYVAAYAREKLPPPSAWKHSLFLQALRQLSRYNPRVIFSKPLFWTVNTVGFGAQDEGGPYRQSLTEISEELAMHKSYLLVDPPSSGIAGHALVRIPNPSAAEWEHFRFLGNLLGGCLFSGIPLALDMPALIWKLLVGSPVDLSDLEEVDNAFVVALTQALANPVEHSTAIMEYLNEEFTTDNVLPPRVRLSDGSFREVVTEEPFSLTNVSHLRVLGQERLHECAAQVEWIRKGLVEVVPSNLVMLLNWRDLRRLVCGDPRIPVDKLKECVQFQSSEPKHEDIFWAAVTRMTHGERSLLCRFITGLRRLPLTFRVEWGPPDNQRLPDAGVCNNVIIVPRFDTVDLMYERLKTASVFGQDIDRDDRVRHDFSAALQSIEHEAQASGPFQPHEVDPAAMDALLGSDSEEERGALQTSAVEERRGVVADEEEDDDWLDGGLFD